MLARKALAGTAGAPKVYVEDVFSTYLYTGNNSTQTITNGIDLSGEGGLVWIKCRQTAFSHIFVDTTRGATKFLSSNTTTSEQTAPNTVPSFSSTGFTAGIDNQVNLSGDNFASWTFRKAEKFFDVVTYTGNGSNRTISHNLGSTPGCIIVKRTDTTSSWRVFHRELDPAASLILNSTAAADYPNNTIWNATNPTSTVFSVGTSTDVNANGGTYVAYLFAHDAGGFGDAGSDNVISCGSFTASSGSLVNIGFEPQFVLIKKTTNVDDWLLFDNMRGLTMGDDSLLNPNTSGAENNSPGNDYINPQPTGFTQIGFGSGTFIYIAIRRGPMKTPTTGTSVFEPVAYSGTSANNRIITASITPDLVTWANRDSTGDRYEYDRLRGSGTWLKPNTTGAEGADGTTYGVQFNKVQTGYQQGTADGGFLNSSSNYVNWLFRRAPGFFDVVCYTGDGTNNRNINHNLGVAPELLIAKRRSATGNWFVLLPSGNVRVNLNNDLASPTYSGAWAGTTPTATTFSLGSDADINASASTYVTYLFASLSGVSKIGTYTGNGSSVTVTTNFQPRFILVKRTDSTGNWIVSDSARGLVSGSDPYLLVNSTAAEDTDEDWVDVSSTSFTVNQTTASNANVNTGTYIYLAIS